MINVFIIKCLHFTDNNRIYLFFVYYCFNTKLNHYMLLFLVSLEQSNFLEMKTHLVIGQEELIDTFLAYAKGIDPVDLKIEGKYINEMLILALNDMPLIILFFIITYLQIHVVAKHSINYIVFLFEIKLSVYFLYRREVCICS